MKKLFFTLSFCLCLLGFSYAQTITEEHTSQWRHFQKVSFKIDGTPAWYIQPVNPLPGNPWIWRAHFPNWHTQMDSILLEKGFHVAYINTNNLYGSPFAMMKWDDFYNYLVHQKNFAPKVALEGVSRGGLYVYGWAKRNTGKVTCIYAEAPVCDFKSWPGGKGRGEGSSGDWKKLLDTYGFSEDEALKYNDQPKDNLEALAAFKVPVLHVINLNDSIVPPEENTLVLVNNYIRKGGPATVIPMTRGKKELQGHHFEIEDPEALANFVIKNSTPVARPLPSENFIDPYRNLDNVLFRMQREKKATVAFLGGSITNMKGWRDLVCRYLRERYPDVSFKFINAGIPSLGSVPHAFRLQSDVLDSGRIDLMFIESAVNDAGNGTPDEEQRRALEGIVRHAYSANPYINMILMAFADEDKIADYQTGKVPPEVKVHEDIARHYHLPFINLSKEVAARIKAGEFTWKDDFKNLHPSLFGQEIYFGTMKTMLYRSFAGKTVAHLAKAPVPKPMQKLNYSNGQYLPVEHATQKNGFTVVPSWKPSGNIHTRPGFVNVPMLIGEQPGSSFRFPFKGNTVGLAVIAGPDAGIIEYSIDGGERKSMNLYTRWSRSLHLPWYIILGDDLSKGAHVLDVRISGQQDSASKGTACRIVHFLVN